MRIGDYEVKGNGLNVSVSFPFPSRDLSGNTSSTVNAEKGIKAKVLRCTLYIKMDEPEQLTELTEVAESVDENGRLKTFVIAEPIADAMRINRVKFHENLFVREDSQKRVWHVSFSLLEVRSIPEKTEERQQQKTPITTNAPGDSVGSTNYDNVIAAVEGVLT